MEKRYLELGDLLARLKAGVESVFPGKVWVKAEVGGMSRKQNGHCYLDLLQSDGGKVCAKVRGTIWASHWGFVDRYFREVTGSPLDVGMEVLVRAQVNFHPVYGLSLNIDEVDPEFTLGANERQKLLTIERLTKEGLMDLQKRLRLPDLPYSLAVISAPGAAGFGDFRHHLLDNEYGFVFDVRLFEALMQGDKAPESMVAALSRILSDSVAYDAVLIMRGGGSELDLACFDDYGLAAAIARCPVPVFTAIGHDKDYHVADMVANTFVKTPTALADLFLDCFIAEDGRLSSYETRLQVAFAGRLSAIGSRLDFLESRVRNAAAIRFSDAAHRLDLVEAKAFQAAGTRIQDASHLLDLVEMRIASADPRKVLEKGFVLALDRNGIRMKSASQASVGDPLRLMFPDGTLRGTVTEVTLSEEDDGGISPPGTTATLGTLRGGTGAKRAVGPRSGGSGGDMSPSCPAPTGHPSTR